MTRAELIAALEAATGPSMELDGQIYCTINGLVFVSVTEAGIRHEPDAKGTHTMVTVTPYTSSIDAALTLVPAGRRWDVSSGWTGPFACLDDPYYGVMGPHHYATTPALALCIAALKAREGKDG